MRSVHLLPSMALSRLTDLLDNIGERQGDEWFGIADKTVEVRVHKPRSTRALVQDMIGEDALSARDVASVESALNDIAGYLVEVRVSGRVEGHTEMLIAARKMLAEGGYGMDDYSGGVWSLPEIEHGRRSGERFRL